MSEVILAIEQSAVGAGMAILRDGQAAAIRHWEARGRRGQPLFDELRGAMREDNLDLAGITAFAVGLGPGIFSGLRVALAAARALALPGQIPVYGLSSGEAMAHECFSDLAASDAEGSRVVVVGDARRQRLWVGVLEWGGKVPVLQGDYKLVANAELAGLLRPGDRVITPDWERLASVLPGLDLPDGCVVPRRWDPSPVALALCVREHIATGSALLASSPIYMHPPVFVEPKFSMSTP